MHTESVAPDRGLGDKDPYALYTTLEQISITQPALPNVQTLNKSPKRCIVRVSVPYDTAVRSRAKLPWHRRQFRGQFPGVYVELSGAGLKKKGVAGEWPLANYSLVTLRGDRHADVAAVCGLSSMIAYPF